MQLSDFLYFGSGYVGVVLLDLQLGLLNEVAVTLVVLGKPVAIAVRAVAGLAPEAEEAHLFVADEAPGVVLLLGLGGLRNLGHLELLYLFLDALLLLLLPGLLENYLKQTEHMLPFCGFPKNFWHLTHIGSDIEVTLC